MSGTKIGIDYAALMGESANIADKKSYLLDCVEIVGEAKEAVSGYESDCLSKMCDSISKTKTNTAARLIRRLADYSIALGKGSEYFDETETENAAMARGGK